MSHPDKPVVVVVPGDLHLTEPGLENVQAARQVIDDVNTLIRPDFVQFIGDNVQDATEEQFQLFDQIRGRLDVPHFAMIGDHDIKNDPGAEGFRRHNGEPYGATSLCGFRFIRLNTQESRPTGISAEQIDWFRRELDQADTRDERVVVFQHNYPYQIWEEFAGPGIDDWRVLVQTRRVEAIICGHTHYWQMSNDGRNALVAVRSIGDPEGGAAGYAVLYCRGDDLAVTYRSVDDRGPVVLVTHPRQHLLASPPPSPSSAVRTASSRGFGPRRACGPYATRSTTVRGPASSCPTTPTGRVGCPATVSKRESIRSRWRRWRPTGLRALKGSISWSTRQAVTRPCRESAR